jgi:hypothetical protein
VHFLQGIDPLLELDVVRGELGLSRGISELDSTVAARELAGTLEDVLHVLRGSHLVLDLANLLLDILLGPSSPGCEGSTVEASSAYLELHAAKSSQERNRRGADVRDALSECCDLSKIFHGDVCKVRCL